MRSDEIVEETRKLRDEYAAEFGHDLAAIVADLKEKQRQNEHRIVRLRPKPPTDAPLAKAS